MSEAYEITDGRTRGKHERQQNFLRVWRDATTQREATELAGISETVLFNWRREREFAKAFDKIKATKHTRHKSDEIFVFDPFRQTPHPGGLVDFRRRVFGFPSTETQRAFAEAYDDRTNLVLFWIAAAGAGKDVTSAQMTAHAAALNAHMDGEGGRSPYPRIGYLMESERQATKRIDAYLDPYFTHPQLYGRAPSGVPGATEPEVNFIEEWGPWKWDKKLRLPDGTRPPRTKWEKFQKWFVGRTTPMADPSLWAVGLEGAIAGSRVQLLVCSDLFTVENQRSAAYRRDQLALINGTLQSRLDDAGRLVFLNHHVRARGESNLVALMDSYIGSAKPIYKNGSYTKYANGVAVILTPALSISDGGELVSYWPEMYPVKGTLILGGETYNVDELSDAELLDLSDKGAYRRRGLAEERLRNPDLFELIYQQNPETSGYGDFTSEILDGCDDPERTLGVARPGEVLVVGVDPARSGGAGWLLWGYDPESKTFTVVDYWWGEGLGFTGMRTQLVQLPIEKWNPRYYIWEENYEGDPRDHPDAAQVIRSHHVQYKSWRTQFNRSGGDFPVVGMLDDMRDGHIRFPAATESDKIKMRLVKDHFMAFESVGYTERRRTVGSRRIPDELCLAGWMGWAWVNENLKKSSVDVGASAWGVSSAVADAFGGYRR